jgi:acyl-coenzyme A synthetase/AMP-(fatty) acid ligase
VPKCCQANRDEILLVGNIEFLGREDFQVKVQGYRVELGEIETILSQHPQVQTAVVTATGAAAGNKRLVAYVVRGGATGIRYRVSSKTKG